MWMTRYPEGPQFVGSELLCSTGLRGSRIRVLEGGSGTVKSFGSRVGGSLVISSFQW